MEFTNGDTDIHPHTNATLVPTSSDESHTHTHTHAHIHTITYTHTCWWVSECKTHNSIKDVSVNQAVLLIAYFGFCLDQKCEIITNRGWAEINAIRLI